MGQTLDLEHLTKTGERKLITLQDRAIRDAERQAVKDITKGLSADHTRHGARSGSLWANAYNRAYEAGVET